MTSLRERQSRLTRVTILEAVEDLMAEGRVDFSVQDVADRAGVSHRTVYRHYETRDALVDGLMEQLQKRLAEVTTSPGKAEEVPTIVRETFAALDGISPAVETIIAQGVATDRPSRLRGERSTAFLAAFGEVTGHLDPTEAEAVVWTLRHLSSNQTWVRLRREAGIDGVRSGRAVAWAVEVLLDALRRGEGPNRHEIEREA